MIATLLLAATVAVPDSAQRPNEPTPEEIYRAGRTPFAAMIESSELPQEFVEQSDGTFLGTVRPSFEQQQRLPPLAREQYSNVLGSWDAVDRRIGAVHDENGKLVPLQAAFGIKDADKTRYLAVTAVDSQSKPGQHVCVSMITGISESQPQGFKKPELLPRRFGALVGCGLVKNILVIIDEEKTLRADSLAEATRLRNEVSDKIAEVLGYQITRREKVMKDGAEESAIEAPKGGEQR